MLLPSGFLIADEFSDQSQHFLECIPPIFALLFPEKAQTPGRTFSLRLRYSPDQDIAAVGTRENWVTLVVVRNWTRVAVTTLYLGTDSRH